MGDPSRVRAEDAKLVRLGQIRFGQVAITSNDIMYLYFFPVTTKALLIRNIYFRHECLLRFENDLRQT